MNQQHTPYKLRAAEQGRDWAKGISKHNDVDDECCPDFSCCVPSLFIRDKALRVANYNVWAMRNRFELYTND